MVWLSISIFCNKNNWHSLLSNGIAPFVSADKKIVKYRLEFNYLSGANIRLSLLANETDAPVVAKHADEYFKYFFLNAGLSIHPVKLPVEGIFMPFPANTIQYGLYPHRTIKVDENEGYDLSVNLSQIILVALKHDIIDDETILTFGFYLKMGLVKAILSINEQFSNSLMPAPGVSTSDIDISAFEESKETLIEIARDIFYPTSVTEMPEWFGSWVNSCETAINHNSTSELLKIRYVEISTLIYKHLDLSAKMNALLTCFIERVLFNENILKLEYAKN